ncbi:bleomycin resistance protein [Lacinutrix sp. C3R15]|uniref:VOC family protein n=1 Tax=Flavobacteriaceae TaxID=49546 RepID=UPI001C0A1D10|nr:MULTISPECIES: bleomycin resistance protein [Flavobacteriaceae]MBU2939135.1 bleomycin resistance protein [Lacinutrix sp. C3R15]MDO6622451.1 bleomycin resistance protein [Oceanihabitans sp. 1_MG-2023]
METSFHMSLPCLSVTKTKDFYTTNIGASLGRMTKNWIDINLYNHQLTFIKAEKFNFNTPNYVFEGKILPAFHFGVIVNLQTWEKIYKKLKDQNLEVVTQTTFLKDKPGEHVSFFVKDPNDYMLEFKSFKDSNKMFAS